MYVSRAIKEEPFQHALTYIFISSKTHAFIVHNIKEKKEKKVNQGKNNEKKKINAYRGDFIANRCVTAIDIHR
jgi:hypothetical protein